MKKQGAPLTAIPSVGWVGVRGYGERLWKSVSQSGYCNIRACFHPDRAVCEEAAHRMRCEADFDFERLAARADMDALVLAVPNEFHFPYAAKALEHGKHVLVEKPLADRVSDAETLVRLADEKKLILAVGHDYRKNAFIRKIKEMLDENKIGKLVAAEMNMSHGGALHFTEKQWRWHRDKCPGGPLNMLGSHLIDTANYLFGEPRWVTASVRKLHAPTTAEDTSQIFIEYENDIRVQITNLYNTVSTEFITIYGTDGALRFTRWPETGLTFQAKDISHNAARYEKIAFEENNPKRELFDEFIRSVMGHGRPEIGGVPALNVVRVIEACLKSSKDQTRVLLSHGALR